MPAKAEFFIVSAQDMRTPEAAANRLNFILSHIADILDAMQGLRGNAVIRGQLIIEDSEGNEIGGFINE